MDLGAAITAVGSMLSVVIGALGIWWIRILNKRHKNDMERMEVDRKAKKEEAAEARRNKKDNNEEMRAVLEEMKIQLADSRNEIHELRNQVQTAVNNTQLAINREARCQADLAAAVERISNLEQRLEDAGIPVGRQWKEPKSGIHKALPKSSPPYSDEDDQPKAPPTGDSQ